MLVKPSHIAQRGLFKGLMRKDVNPSFSIALFRNLTTSTSVHPASKPSLLIQKRSKTTESTTVSMTASENLDLLNSQRRLRPISPHFTIYEPQLTWYSSIFNRVTGVALSGGLYAFALGYAVGLPFDAVTVLAFIKSLPVGVKFAGKMILALPFSFHFWNGLRHLSWDLGYFLNLKTSYQAGYAVLGLTAVSTLGLALL